MGSINDSQETRYGGIPPGKMNAPLSEYLRGTEWGKYKIGDLFAKIDTVKLPYKANELPKQAREKYELPCLTSSFKNQGLNYFAPREGATVLKDVISIPSNSDVYRAYYQSREFTVLSDAYAIQWRFHTRKLSENQYLFMVMCINKVSDLPIYSYKNKLGGWNVLKNKFIQLPQKNNAIDFEYMESYISGIQANRMDRLSSYLLNSGLNSCELTKGQVESLNCPWSWKKFNVKELFEIYRTSSLDSDQLVDGDNYDYITRTSFNQGILRSTGKVEKVVVNDAGTWSLGLLQMDFFYRKRSWYAGQFVRKITSKLPLTENQALFMTTVLNTLSKKLLSVLVRDVDVTFLNSHIWLPAKGNEIDFEAIEEFVTAIQKLLAKNMIKYIDKKTSGTHGEVSLEPCSG